MKTARGILLAVQAIGGRLEPAGDRLRTLLPADCSPELKAAIREHKPALLALLQAKRHNLPDDNGPWIHVARQILAGEFHQADNATVESLAIGLRNINHPKCREALALLPTSKEKR